MQELLDNAKHDLRLGALVMCQWKGSGPWTNARVSFIRRAKNGKSVYDILYEGEGSYKEMSLSRERLRLRVEEDKPLELAEKIKPKGWSPAEVQKWLVSKCGVRTDLASEFVDSGVRILMFCRHHLGIFHLLATPDTQIVSSA